MKSHKFCPQCGRPVHKHYSKEHPFVCYFCNILLLQKQALHKKELEQVRYIQMRSIYNEKDFYTKHSVYKPYPRYRLPVIPDNYDAREADIEESRRYEIRDYPVECHCSMCRKRTIVHVKHTDLVLYELGGKVQNCFPYLSPIQRELIKTGYCSKCQRLLFAANYDDFGKYIDK